MTDQHTRPPPTPTSPHTPRRAGSAGAAGGRIRRPHGGADPGPPIPVLATLPATLNTSVTNVEWLLTSTLLVSAVAVPVFGRLGDMFGKRRMMLVAIAALVVGSLVTCFTSDVTVLIVGRAIQGASMATIPLGISLLSSTLPRERVGSAIA